MRTFKIGDEVQLAEDTALWGQYTTLRQARGKVIGTLPDPAMQNRITVEYPDGTKLTGVDAASFKRAGT